jgi:membrane-bound serine protease (ClpP class)
MGPAVYAIILLAVGVLFIGIEVAIIPGFGFVGILGVGAMLYGGFIAYENFGPAWGFISTAGGVAAAGGTVYFAFKLGLINRLVLEEQITGEPSELPAQAEVLVGQSGIAISDLRPAGIAKITGKRMDVVAAEGEYIESGSAIEITNVDQNSIIVQRHQPQEAES